MVLALAAFRLFSAWVCAASQGCALRQVTMGFSGWIRAVWFRVQMDLDKDKKPEIRETRGWAPQVENWWHMHIPPRTRHSSVLAVKEKMYCLSSVRFPWDNQRGRLKIPCMPPSPVPILNLTVLVRREFSPCFSPVHLSPRLEGQVCRVLGGVQQGRLYLGKVRDGSVCDVAGESDPTRLLGQVPIM